MLGCHYHPAAENEYHEAIRYYSRIRLELGLAFVSEIEKAVAHARCFPEAQRRFKGELRRFG